MQVIRAFLFGEMFSGKLLSKISITKPKVQDTFGKLKTKLNRKRNVGIHLFLKATP